MASVAPVSVVVSAHSGNKPTTSRRTLKIASVKKPGNNSRRNSGNVAVYCYQTMAEDSTPPEPSCQLRRRRSSGNPNLGLNLEVGFHVNEGGPAQGTPSPGCIKFASSREPSSSSALLEFRKKQQSFDIQIEECEEEEILIDSDEETEPGTPAPRADRAVTPTPIQDFGANVSYTEGPQIMDFLKVNTIEQDCLTDVSDADADSEAEGEE